MKSGCLAVEHGEAGLSDDAPLPPRLTVFARPWKRGSLCWNAIDPAVDFGPFPSALPAFSLRESEAHVFLTPASQSGEREIHRGGCHGGGRRESIELVCFLPETKKGKRRKE